jgi:hypothetical protein
VFIPDTQEQAVMLLGSKHLQRKFSSPANEPIYPETNCYGSFYATFVGFGVRICIEHAKLECAKFKSLIHLFLADPGLARGFFGPVMERAEPTIPWHFLIAIIAFVISMMQLMIKRAKRQAAVCHE